MSEQVHGKHAIIRQRKPEPQRDRSIQKKIRFAPDEWKIARQRFMRAKHYEPELTWEEYMMRYALKGKVTVLYVWDPTKIMTLMKRNANNINQVAHRVNTYGGTQQDIEEMKELEHEMLSQIKAVSKDWWKLKATIHHEHINQDEEE